MLYYGIRNRKFLHTGEDMNINSVGEFGLIDLIKQDTISDPGAVVIGIGDDAAAFWPAQDRLQLLTADMLVETVHFDLQWITPWQLGYKALAVNISDIAAMGGRPRQAVVSLALPKRCSVEFVLELYQGMKAIGREFGVNIVGGDTVSSPNNLVINVALTGDVVERNMIRRSGANPGELVLVSGTIGDSAAGLEWLLSGGKPEFQSHLVAAHVMPQPQVTIGQAAASAGATAMDDISDGLASEANEISSASKMGVVIYSEKLPISAELRKFASELGRDPVDYALYGGEDYQLLITMPAHAAMQFCHTYGCTVVGEVTSSRGVILETRGVRKKLEPKGFDHFR